jgi:hypothetical protein
VSAVWEFAADNTSPLKCLFAKMVGGGAAETGPTYEHELSGDETSIKVEATHAYDKPGTYFPHLRVTAHRYGSRAQGDVLENDARIRIVVR